MDFEPKIFSPHPTDILLARRVAELLGTELSPLEERDFEDGEFKIRPLIDVKNQDAIVIQSLYSDFKHSVNDKLVRLLFLIGALKDSGARHVTAMLPYLCFARKDRKTKENDPLSLRYTAQMFESVGTDSVIVLEVHNPAAFENAFRCPTLHIEPQDYYAHYLREKWGRPDQVTVLSPDSGGIKRTENLRKILSKIGNSNVETAFVEKYRSAGTIWGDAIVGAIEGKTILIHDDLITSGGTIERAAKACKEKGARSVFALVTHGLFASESIGVLQRSYVDKIFVSNSVPLFRIEQPIINEKIEIIDIAPLLVKTQKKAPGLGASLNLLKA